jgi:hypothetical protein
MDKLRSITTEFSLKTLRIVRQNWELGSLMLENNL